MSSKRFSTCIAPLLYALLTLSFLTITDAGAQTREGGTPPRRFPGSDFEEQKRYKGTRVIPDPKALGDDLALQSRIASLLNKEDFVPDQRKVHFRWMSKSEHTPIAGWCGMILDMVADRDGTIVTVRIGPIPVNGFWTSCSTIERYRFADGKLRFLDLVYKGGASTWN